MNQKIIFSALVASTVLAAPLITGKILRPDGNPIANVIVQLKSTLEKDTTDAAGVYAIGVAPSSSSSISPLSSSLNPSSSSENSALRLDNSFVIKQEQDQLHISLNSATSIHAELLSANGSLLQDLLVEHSSALSLRLPRTAGVQFLRLTIRGQSQIRTIVNGILQKTLQQSHPALARGLIAADTLLLTPQEGISFNAPIANGIDVIPDIVIDHKKISGLYDGADDLGTLNMSNSSQGFKISHQVSGAYLFETWSLWPSGKILNPNETWRAYISIGNSYSPFFEFKTSEEWITGPAIKVQSSSFYSSSSVSSSSISSSAQQISYGTLTDPRDHKTYKTVVIGTQEWMAENLNYGSILSSSSSPSDAAKIEKFCPSDSASCDTYGAQYWWTEAMNLPANCNTEDCSGQIPYPHQGACPAGWHVATDPDYQTLEKNAGMSNYELSAFNLGMRGYSTAKKFITESDGGSDSYGFKLLLNGSSFYWTGTPDGPGNVISRSYSANSIFRGTLNGNYGPSIDFRGFIRCVRDTSALSSSSQGVSSSSSRAISFGTTTDARDNKTYKTVAIGDQEWFAENLNYGSILGSTASPSDASKIEKFCPSDSASCDLYGGQYWWTEAMNLPAACNAADCSPLIQNPHQGACPADWHVATDPDYQTLEKYAGMSNSHLTATLMGNRGFNVVNKFISKNDGGTDLFGFNLLLNGSSFYWTGTPDGPGNVFSRSYMLSSSIFRGTLNGNYGPSIDFRGFVRCVRNTSSSSVSSSSTNSSSSFSFSSSSRNISYSTITDARDGRSYKTVAIGKQVWMAENLNYGTAIHNKATPSNSALTEKFCPTDSNSCEIFGGLYWWTEAMDLPARCNTDDCSALIQPHHRGICPANWHVASDSDYQVLEKFSGMPNTELTVFNTGSRGRTVVDKLISLADGGSDLYGFNLLLFGSSFFWTSTLDGPGNAISRNYYVNNAIYRGSLRGNYGPSVDFSGFVRCVQN